MLLTNGRIHTMDARSSVVDTLVIRDGRMVFAGRRRDVNPGIGERIVDLDGRSVVPGLTDAHAHLAIMARTRLALDVTGAASEDAVVRSVAECLRALAPGEWVGGRGWDQTLWPEKGFPAKASLDRVAPRNPVALVRIDGHATWANSRALAAAGITRATSDPAGGIILRGADGEPTGVLIDAAQELVRNVEPEPSDERLDAAVSEAIGECLRKGLTGIHEMGADPRALDSYRRLIERGRFPFRNYAAVSGRKAWAEYGERGPEIAGDAQLVVRAMKLWLDGALGSRGAALHDPYCDDPTNLGLLLIPPEEVERLTRDALARGFQVCVHAIGDRANSLVLDAFERVLASLDAPAGPRQGRRGAGDGATPPARRLRVEHAQILRPADVPRFSRLGVLPSMQPTHCTSDMRWAPERLGPERLEGAYAWRSVLDTGTIIAGGSDFPVEDPNPFHGIHAAITRRPLTGDDPGWQAHQRMTREEAMRAFTVWNAYASGREADLGSLEPGKRADLVVLDDDPFSCAEDRVKDITPVATLVGGQCAWGALPETVRRDARQRARPPRR
jgi:predicted amidohydrolase YtcJ